MNAIVIDPNLYRPCLSRRLSLANVGSGSSNSGGSGSGSLTHSPPPATSPPASNSPDSTLSASSASSHFKLDGACISGESNSPSEAEAAISFDQAFEKNGHKMALPAVL